MVERRSRRPELELVLPPNLKQFTEMARGNTYAAGVEPQITRDGFKLLSYKSPLFLYVDRWNTSRTQDGAFGGMEIVRDNDNTKSGFILLTYTYAGGLTEEGIKLGKDAVFPELRWFLKKFTKTAHFGLTMIEHKKAGRATWTYRSRGLRTPWGWMDREEMLRKGKLIYNLGGQGSYYGKRV